MRRVLLILTWVFGVCAVITFARHENEVQIVAGILYVGFAVVFIALREILAGINRIVGPARKERPPKEEGASFFD